MAKRETYKADLEVDVRGYSCPVPVFKLNQAIGKVNAGQNVKVLATDPGTKRDFESWAKLKGHRLLYFSEENGEFICIIQKAT